MLDFLTVHYLIWLEQNELYLFVKGKIKKLKSVIENSKLSHISLQYKHGGETGLITK